MNRGNLVKIEDNLTATVWQGYVRIDMPSDSVPDLEYPVFVTNDLVLCGCPGFKYYGKCKHASHVKEILDRRSGERRQR